MTTLTDAIDLYHTLLDDDTAAESQAQLDDQQLRRGLYFGSRKICTVLRPRFMTSAQYRFLQDAIQSIMPAFDKAYRAALAGGPIRDQFKLAAWEEQLIDADPGFAAQTPSSISDFIFVNADNNLLITTTNAMHT